MSKHIAVNKSDNIYRRQASLGGNKIVRETSPSDGNVELVWGLVTNVYYQKGTCDFRIKNRAVAIVDNSGSNGTYSAPIPVDYYGTNYDGTPFVKTRLIQKGNKVLVAFVEGKSVNPVIIGVYPNSTDGYEVITPALANTINSNSEDSQGQVLNQIEIDPSSQILYQSGKGDFAKSMQGHSFLIVKGDTALSLDKIATSYKNIPYFYNRDSDNQPNLIESVNTNAPEWLLVHEGNWETSGNSDKHRTRFYVNKYGKLQIVFFTVDNPEEMLVFEGDKDSGFTLVKQYDSNQPNYDGSKDYVKFTLGKNHNIVLSSSSASESQAQSQTLEINSQGIYVNGQLLTDIAGTNAGNNSGSGSDNTPGITIDKDEVKKIINETTGIDDWDAFKDNIDEKVASAEQAANDAKQAGEDAKAAGDEALQAGLDAEVAGNNAGLKVDDLKAKMVYYLNLSPEKDIFVPGKFLILNEDVTVQKAFIKEGYIDTAAIDTANIKNAAITGAKIKDLSVYNAKIANAAITNAKIANAAITNAKIADAAIDDAKINHLTFKCMEGETLDANYVRIKNLTADAITAHTITVDKLNITDLGSISHNLGDVNQGTINAGQGNVTIKNLPADDPDMLTPADKANLQREVNTLGVQIKAMEDFVKDSGIPQNEIDALNTAYQKLSNDVIPYLADMNSTTEYDHNLIDDDLQNVQSDLSNLEHFKIQQIGTTADGKSKIYVSATAPENPSLGDIWATPNNDGFQVFGEDGWYSPTEDVYNRIQKEINSQPRTYYQTETPSDSNIIPGSIWYKGIVDATNHVSYQIYVYDSKRGWIPYRDANLDNLPSTTVSNTAPSNAQENDIWVDSSNQNSLKIYHNGKWINPSANSPSVNEDINNVIKKIPTIYYQSDAPTGDIPDNSTWYQVNKDGTYTIHLYQGGQWTAPLDSNIQSTQNQLSSSITSLGSSLGNDINNVSKSVIPINLWVESDLFNGWVDSSSGDFNSSDTDKSTDYIPVKPGEYYTIQYYGSLSTPSNANGAVFDANKNYVSDFCLDSPNAVFNNDGTYNYVTGQIPSNGAYLRVSFNIEGSDNTTHFKISHSQYPSAWTPAPQDLNKGVYQYKEYHGVKINDTDGIKVISGNNEIDLNADSGIKIIGNSDTKLSMDSSGNLIMKGNLVAGNISGVTIGGVNFKGSDMELDNNLTVKGKIIAGNSTIDSNGININSGILSLGDSKGTHTIIDDKGNLTTNAVNITGGTIKLTNSSGVTVFGVDDKGNAVFSGNLSGVNISGEKATISSSLDVIGDNGEISAANGNVVLNNNGISIHKGTIAIGGTSDKPVFSVQSDGTVLATQADITGNITVKSIKIANDADDPVLNANGNFTVSKDGSVMAADITLTDTQGRTGTVTGGILKGSQLELGNSEFNALYQEDIYDAQVDSYGFRSGHSNHGFLITPEKFKCELGGIRENKVLISANDFVLHGYLDGSGNLNPTTCDLSTKPFPIDPNRNLYLYFGNTPSSDWSRGNLVFLDANQNCLQDINYGDMSGLSQYNTYQVQIPQNAAYVGATCYVHDDMTLSQQNDFYNQAEFVMWQGNQQRGYTVVNNQYGTDINVNNYLQSANNGLFLGTLDTSGLQDGDVVHVIVEANYDYSPSRPGTTAYMVINGLSGLEANSKYFGSDNEKYVITGLYHYEWSFVYNSSLGNSVTLNINIDNMYTSSRFYVTNLNILLYPINNSVTNLKGLHSNNGFPDSVTTYTTQSLLNGAGSFRQSWLMETDPFTDGGTHGGMLKDFELNDGVLTLSSQEGTWHSDGQHTTMNYPFVSTIISGTGISFLGNRNNISDKYTYPNAGAVVSFWGDTTHEEIVADSSTPHGDGITMDTYGNIRLMDGSDNWNISTNPSADWKGNFVSYEMAKFSHDASVQLGTYKPDSSNVLSISPDDGVVRIGRMFINAKSHNSMISGGGLSNEDSEIGLDGNGYIYSNVTLDVPGLVNRSTRSSKYNISQVNDHSLTNAILATDVGKYHYKNVDSITDPYHYGPIIEDTSKDEYQTPDIFLNARRDGLDMMTLTAALIQEVQSLRKSITDLTLNDAFHEIRINNLNQLIGKLNGETKG